MKHLRGLILQIFESIVYALQAIRQNKTRALLSTLGITIGIFCIIMVLTLVESLERNIQKSVDAFGKNVIFIEKWPWTFSDDYKWWKYMNRPNPRLDELKAINERSQLLAASSLVVTMNGGVLKYESNSASGVTIRGVSHDYYKLKKLDFFTGRYFTDGESRSGSHVAIIGSSIAENLFGTLNPIDKHISVRGRKYQVVGVLVREGESLLGMSTDNELLVPVQNVANYIRINSDRANAQIQVMPHPDIPLEMLEEELRGIMRSKRKLRPNEEINFALNKTTLIAEPLKQLFGVINFAGWIIGGFAMLVGGFGIANIMFVSVKERTNQIGIQKALGAKKYFILIEFLVESVVLCLVGGGLGIALVWSIAFVANQNIDFEIYLSLKNVITGIVVSITIGLLSGMIPAKNAASLDPVEAMRAK
jgi:putative ABC transport system permease protein